MDQHKLRTYAGTVLEFDRDPGRAIDLRRVPDPEALSLLADHGLSGPFAVLTAFNPRGSRLDGPEADRANERAQARLEDLMQRGGQAFVRVDGCSPDRSHREPSVAARITEAVADQVARRFEQDAYFWFDGVRFWIVGVLEPFGRVELPMEAAPAQGRAGLEETAPEG